MMSILAVFALGLIGGYRLGGFSLVVMGTAIGLLLIVAIIAGLPAAGALSMTAAAQLGIGAGLLTRPEISRSLDRSQR